MEVRPAAQESDVKKKLVILFSIVLALLVVLVCIVDIFLYRRRQAARPAQPQVVQPVTAEPKTIPTIKPALQYLPVMLNSNAPEPAVVDTPAPATDIWRFLSINDEDIGTFENVADPAQRLTAKCIDPGRPPPKKGEIYYLDEGGILKLEDGTKHYQRFKVTAGQ